MESKKGYLYCMSNYMFSAHGKDVYKLGETSNIEKRMASYTTSYIYPVVVEYSTGLLEDSQLAEKILFHKLKRYRIFDNREFFKCEKTKIIEAMDEIVNLFGNKTINEIRGEYFGKTPKRTVEKGIVFDEKNIGALMSAIENMDGAENSDFGLNKVDSNVMLVKYIKSTYGLKKISGNFLTNLEKEENIDEFNKSVLYFMDKKYMDGYINHIAKHAIFTSLEKELKKIDLIRETIKLFWDNNIFSDSVIHAYSKDIYPKEKNLINIFPAKKDFFQKNTDKMVKYFKSLERKEVPNYEFKMVDWIKCMLVEYFGGFARIAQLGDRYRNKISNKTEKKIYYRYYKHNLEIKDYIELLLNKNRYVIRQDILDKIKDKYGNNTECKYSDLHGCQTFGDLYNKKDESALNMAKEWESYVVDDIESPAMPQNGKSLKITEHDGQHIEVDKDIIILQLEAKENILKGLLIEKDELIGELLRTNELYAQKIGIGYTGQNIK